MNYLLHILIMICIYLILALSLNLLVGYSGLLSLAQAAFYGIGGYATTLFMVNLKINFFFALPLAALFTFFLAYIIGKISLVFKEDFFVLVTLGFQIIIFSILYNWVKVTKGPYGIPGIPKPSLFGFEFSELWSFLILSLIVATIVFFYFQILHKSSFSLYLKGIRDNELAFISSGKNPSRYKTFCFLIAGGIAAISGGLYCTYVTYIDPTSFTLEESIFIISIIMIGGTGNLKGPFIGTIFMVLLPEALRFLGLPDTIAPNVRQIIYGLLLIILMRFRPQGLLGEYKFE